MMTTIAALHISNITTWKLRNEAQQHDPLIQLNKLLGTNVLFTCIVGRPLSQIAAAGTQHTARRNPCPAADPPPAGGN